MLLPDVLLFRRRRARKVLPHSPENAPTGRERGDAFAFAQCLRHHGRIGAIRRGRAPGVVRFERSSSTSEVPVPSVLRVRRDVWTSGRERRRHRGAERTAAGGARRVLGADAARVRRVAAGGAPAARAGAPAAHPEHDRPYPRGWSVRKTRSGRQAVLMKQSAETIAAMDMSGEVWRWHNRTTRSGRSEGERPMRAVTVAMVHDAAPCEPSSRTRRFRQHRSGLEMMKFPESMEPAVRLELTTC